MKSKKQRAPPPSGPSESPSSFGAASTAREPAPAKRLAPAGSPLRFFLVFVGLLATFQLLFVTVISPSALFAAYMRLNASATVVILRWFGSDVQAMDGTLIAGNGSLEIKRGCDAVQPCGIFVGAVLAFPAPLRAKWIAIAIGCPLLLFVNLLRIISLYYASVSFPSAFELLHEGLWPAAFIALALLLWFLWIQRLRRAPSATS